MPAIPLPDAGSNSILNAARADSEQSLRDAYPGQNVPMPGSPGMSAPGPAAPQDSDTYTAEPPDDAVDMASVMPGPEKPPKSATDMKPASSHGNGDLWSLSNVHDFLKDEFKGSGEEAALGVTRGLLKLGKGTTTLVGGGLASVADHVATLLTGRTKTGAEDAVFDYQKNYIDPAIEGYTPQRAENVGQDEGSGGAAQAIGGAAEVVPAMAGGAPGAIGLVASSGVNTATEALDKGHSLKTAAAEGAVDAIATAAQLMIPGGSLPLVKRVLVQVPAGDIAAVAGDYAKKKILESSGHKKEADQIDPLAQLGPDTLQNIVFGVLGGHRKAAKGESSATPTAESTEMPAAEPVATPVATPAPPPAAGPAPPEAAPVTGSTPPVADKPSAEPVKDLRAQWRDMNDPKTPRVGVFLSTDNLQNIKTGGGKDADTVSRQLEQARSQGRVITMPNGDLVLKNAQEKLKAQTKLGRGIDPQAVIGEATGAGDGKQPTDTVVVQGHDAQGAVATESAVRPDEVSAKVSAISAEGKTPVVTTPEAAVQRRAAEVAKENAPPVEAVPMEASKPASEPEPAPKEVTDEDEAGPSIERGIIKTGGGDRAVVIEDKTPDAEGKIKVRPINDEGEPGDVIRVPHDSLSSGAAGESSAPAKEQPTEKAEENSGPTETSSKSPMLEQLAEARSDFENSQQPPAGRKYPGSVKERAGNVANFARVLKGVASTMKGEDAAHAVEMAKRAERVDLKSDEAIAKGQGVGHTELASHAENLSNAARKLIEPEFERPAPKVAVQEKLKAKIERTKAEPAEKPQLIKKPASEKVKVIADVEDETKPKELNKGEQMRLKAAGDRLIKAKDEDLDASRAAVEKVIAEVYGHRMAPDDRAAFMSFLEGERRDRLRPKSRDEEIDEEFSDHRHDNGDEDPLEARVLGAHEVHPAMADLHASLEKSGMYPKMREAAANGTQYNARGLLEHMASNAKGPLKDFLTKLAAHMPDGTKIRPVSEVFNTRTGNKMSEAGGLFEREHDLIQVLMKGGGDTRLTPVIIHEAVHAATVHLARGDPMHPFVRESQRLRQVFENRLRRRLGDDVVQQHLDFHRGHAGKPTDLINNLYGLKDHLEFMAEAMSNPKFMQLIAESEAHRVPHEGFLGGAHKLADAVVGAIRRALNIVTNREAKLLAAVMRNVEDVMDAQRTHLSAESPRAAEDDFRALASMNEDPKPLREESRLRSVVGDTHATIARQFYRAVQSKSLHALRRLVLANETHDQIVRSNAHWFGKDNETNPLRQYEDIQQRKTAIQNNMLERARGIVVDRQKLDRQVDRKLGQFQIDSTQWGIDPDVLKANLPKTVTSTPNFEARYTDFMNRWNALSNDAKAVYRNERDHLKWSGNQVRKAAVDAALDTFTDRDVSAAQRSLLYSVRTKGDFDGLIGSGKLIDVGDRNDGLRKSLQELAGLNQVAGPYFHLGRHGDYVVQVHPEGEKEFGSQAEAARYADSIRDFGPTSKAKVAERGGKWVVDYKAQYVSMHESAHDAETEAQRLREQGHEVGQVTNKIEAQSGGALSSGMQTLVAEASRKLERRGSGPETKALTDALRGTFVQMVADRSAYAASKLARRGFAGVKAAEMGRNFASHVQSTAWNLGNLATTFRQGEALGRIREASKSPDSTVPQAVVYKRGAVMRELGKRTAQEVSQYGIKNPVNAITAKLGYMNFLASPAHTFVNLTQNFTTAIPVAGARWGYGKTIAAFTKATRLIAGPTFRAAMKAHMPSRFNAEDMAAAVIKSVAKDPQLGKWAQGANSHLKQLLDRGIISSTFATEIGHMAQGGNPSVQRVFDYARTLPQMAEVYNRVSTALAGLEMTGGDLAKTADFIRESHVDYTQANKTRVAKMVAKVPGANTLTMFRTYIQGMRHLLYSNVKNMVTAEGKSRAEAAKTVAGLILAQSIFAGVVKGALIEPLRASVYAYNQLFGDQDDYMDLDNATRRFVSDVVGNRTVADAITGGLPHLLGFDLSSRMGLSDLFLHNPPDLLHADSDEMMKFLGTQLGGPMGQMVAEQKDAFVAAMDRGDAFGMLTSLVPIKLLRDVSKAYDLGTTGKRSGNGGQLTSPSGLNAAYQVMGLKPSEVAQVQAKQGTAAEYHQFTQDRKARLMKAYGGTDNKGSIMDQIRSYNAANPGNPITYRDFVRQMRGAAAATNTANGGPEKDPRTRELLDY